MTRKEMICIVCPVGCQLEALIEEGAGISVEEVKGYLCKKGLRWAEQELVNPVRILTSNIGVDGGELPLVSVRTDSPIPRESIADVMKIIKSARVKAPVRIGDPLIVRPAGADCTVIATKNVHVE
jgi:CxxC motif-containing protein